MKFKCLSSIIVLIAAVLAESRAWSQDTSAETASDILFQAYNECLQDASFSCLRPKIASFLHKALAQGKIRITRDLAIVRREGAPQTFTAKQDEIAGDSNSMRMLEDVEEFVSTHDLRMRLPRELVGAQLSSFVPEFLTNSIPEQLTMPLAPAAPVAQERGFMKKVVLPFLIGLKFKATALLPLALALIALKTWKALTLGLLSIVLSGAMVIFKFAKPKIHNFHEIIHYAHTPIHHPVVEHANYEHFHGHANARSADLAYRGYAPQEE
ncbi:uncharacterized protein LOC111057006 [Nilaparvata lugens]|uniref:uncharacterized protein LOC111057006 n=1 Tax=Nilaparvata lugens TaxID=108931 RepID=UPI00193E7B6E|nr:uncharacterized protein LOC111057006 [Nilaparvata lugens]